MQLITAVLPLLNVADYLFRQGWSALCQQICLFMPIRQEEIFRCIGLLKNQMPHRSESSKPPCLHELVHLMPAIETDAKGIPFQNPENLSKGRLKPIRPIVVGYSLSVAGYILCNIRWVSQNHVNTRAWK